MKTHIRITIVLAFLCIAGKLTAQIQSRIPKPPQDTIPLYHKHEGLGQDKSQQSEPQDQRKPSPPVVDIDMDGIDDSEEKALLERFRPYLRFSNDGGDEKYKPTDVMWYIKHSTLIAGNDEETDPVVLQRLSDPSDIIKIWLCNILNNPVVTINNINPFDEAQAGSEWKECLSQGNIGLYGHVVPYKEHYPQTDFISSGLDFTKTYYKIEFWQFFGYNAAGQEKWIADHEGDWTTVQLLYSQTDDSLISVYMYAHGSQFRFDMANRTDFALIDDNTLEIRGPNNKWSSDLDLVDFHLFTEPHYTESNDFWKAQNNLVRFYRDPVTGEFSHPVVYIEHGTHEFYPSPNWNYYAAPNHNGESENSYLSATPPNLGEVEHPLNEYEGAAVILQFNGSWGAYSSVANEPGPGPTFHRQWTWPANSSIGLLLHDLPF